MATISIDRTTQRFSSSAQPEPDVDVLHTTEGMSWPGYAGGGEAPHGTIRPLPGKGILVREHIDFDLFAKALMNLPGGVETNRRGALQFELMGTCDEKHKGDPDWYFWPDADDVVLTALADYLRPIHAKYLIPNSAPLFKAYRPDGVHTQGGSYGPNNGVRFDGPTWLRYNGIVGHMHVPENDHGDPGAFPIAKLMTLLAAGGTSVVTPPKPAPKPAPSKAPAFPLPRGYYFGPRYPLSNKYSVSGYYSHRADLMVWQSRMRERGWVNTRGLPLVVDGYYGDETARVAKLFQQQCGIDDDSLIGVMTWGKSWTEPVT
jgi:peptidoglycan hydrolase-like protein with peptidoglycan-binding domain